MERSLRGKVAIVGIGETKYYKHGQSPEPEFKLALMAILAAAADAGIDPSDIDSFASYSNDRNDPSRLAAALGTKELRLSNTPGRRSLRARPTSRWCTVRWRKASSSVSVAPRRAAPSRATMRLSIPMAS